MPSETVFVLGDAHLGPGASAVEAVLHQFLAAVPCPGDRVVILGDLFEFWFEYRRVIPRSAFATLAVLRQLGARGVRLVVVGGNHDRWGASFWRQELGAAFYPRAAELELAGWRSWLAHGDGLAEPEAAARALHWVVNRPATAALFRWLHPDVGYRLVERWSGRTLARGRSPALIERAARAQERWARARLEARPDLELLILGHTHRPVLQALGPRRCYLNPGAWMDGYCYAVITERGPELARYRPQ